MKDIKSDRERLEEWIKELMEQGDEESAEIVRKKAEEHGWNNEKTFEAVMGEMFRQIEQEEGEMQQLIGGDHYGRNALQEEKNRREKGKQSTYPKDNQINDVGR